MAVSRICQVETEIISRFPKPQVAGPIPAEGANEITDSSILLNQGRARSATQSRSSALK